MLRLHGGGHLPLTYTAQLLLLDRTPRPLAWLSCLLAPEPAGIVDTLLRSYERAIPTAPPAPDSAVTVTPGATPMLPSPLADDSATVDGASTARAGSVPLSSGAGACGDGIGGGVDGDAADNGGSQGSGDCDVDAEEGSGGGSSAGAGAGADAGGGGGAGASSGSDGKHPAGDDADEDVGASGGGSRGKGAPPTKKQKWAL